MVAPSLSLPSLIPKWPFPIFYGGQQQHQAVISIPSSLSFSLFQRVKERSRHHCAPRERERSGQFEAFKSQIELLHCRALYCPVPPSEEREKISECSISRPAKMYTNHCRRLGSVKGENFMPVENFLSNLCPPVECR